MWSYPPIRDKEEGTHLIVTHKTISVRDYFTCVVSICNSGIEKLHFACVIIY